MINYSSGSGKVKTFNLSRPCCGRKEIIRLKSWGEWGTGIRGVGSWGVVCLKTTVTGLGRRPHRTRYEGLRCSEVRRKAEHQKEGQRVGGKKTVAFSD